MVPADLSTGQPTGNGHSVDTRGMYYTFRPPVGPVAVGAPITVGARGRYRYLAAGTLLAAATIALVHGLYFSLVFNHTEAPLLDQVTMGLAICACIGVVLVVMGRRIQAVYAIPLLLVVVAIWDIVMGNACWCPHRPMAVYFLVPLVIMTEMGILRARSEFLDRPAVGP